MYSLLDSVGKPQTNLYQYAGNNPVNFIDPMGLWEWGVGGTAGPVTIGYNSWDTDTSVTWNTNLGIGGGFKICFDRSSKNDCSDNVPQTPWWLNAGLNQWLGVSTDNKRVCINIGLAKSVSPVWLSKPTHR